ncbi:MAG: glycosyltransferase [Bryobacteraceae bacterium]
MDSSASGLRILWVKVGGLLPPDTGGKIRSLQTLKQLARSNQVTLVTFYKEIPDDPHPSLASIFHKVVCIPQKTANGGLGQIVNYLQLLFSRHAYSMQKWYTRGLRERIEETIAEGSFDCIVCDFLYPAGVVPWQGPEPRVLFTHNVEAEIWRRQYQLEKNPLRKLAYWREYRTLVRDEDRYVRLAAHVLTVSDRDRDEFAKVIDASKITAVPTGVDVDYFAPSEQEPESGNMVFTGSMDWAPNEDCVQYFARDIWPLVRTQAPESAFWAVGRRPSETLRALHDGRSIHITGTVDDIRPYLQRAQVYLVPMRSGSGTRLKIFEAMAAGKAVVSTTIGAEGLPVTHGENILLADTPQEFAAAAVRVMNDAGLRKTLGRNARRLVEEKYSWAAAGRFFEEILWNVVLQSRHKR